MNTILGLLVVIVVSGLLSTAAAAVFVRGLSAVGTGFTMMVSILIGYLMASTFFQWQQRDGWLKRSIVFPAVVALLSVIGAFVGLGPTFARAYGASLVPHHAGMSAWFLGIVASTVVIGLAVRLAIYFSSRPPDPTSSWELPAARGAGVLLLLLLMLGHALAGPSILRQFGPDASFETAIASIVRSVVFLAPLMTVVGFILDKRTRSRVDRRRWVLGLLAVVVLVAFGEVSYRFSEAGASENGQWWIDQEKSRR
jgi:hypothetical protein